MSKTLLIVGFGIGVSRAVAERFGAEGFSVGLVARDESRLAAGVEALKAKGLAAAAFPADAADPAAIRRVVEAAKAALGPIGALHWNAYSGRLAGDLLSADPGETRGVFDVAISGLVAAVQAARADLRASRGAVLVTNGAYGELGAPMDAFAIATQAMGLALGNAAKHKLVGLLAQALKDDGVHVGEVMIAGAVKGTPSDDGSATIDSATVADAFWRLYEGRAETYARIS